ncbi:MAG: ANTAR domain-containing protein [Desulfarculaceae bacterium]|nr:ANTAR domain-containing protein [Desulfarculaceae bacterium]MCF8073153.1 ANTAR domain-containing protein [Desulfarculaceae bacterium]MCF8101762.1 ANTAR domain-containing protein [Desulfarculaceae bacterium]MCF8118400.1 ANTAR domain-containing protein [Desulfarculaceae bacterium]
MNRLRIAMLHQNGSPLNDMLGEALAQAEVLELDPAAPTLPEDARCGGRLVLWDLWGFDEEQRRAWALVLAANEVGLVVAAAVLDQAIEGLSLDCHALGLIGPSHGAGLARMVLTMAADWQERYCHLWEQLEQAKRQLADREIIERAKSIVIAALGLSEPEAMSKLQQQARSTNQKLVEVAKKIIATNRIFNGDKE